MGYRTLDFFLKSNNDACYFGRQESWCISYSLLLVANPCDARENSEKCSRNSIFFFFNSSSSRLMNAIRLIPNIHVLEQQI